MPGLFPLLAATILLGPPEGAVAPAARATQDATSAPETPPPETPPPETPPSAMSLPGAESATPPKAPSRKTVFYGVGANYQFLIVPQFFLKAFLEAAKSPDHNLFRHTFGLHFVRRKKSLDMVVRLMFGFMMGSQDNGNWLGRGHDWNELDYTEFHDLNFLWADVSFIYHWEVAPKFFLGVGGGVGLGWVMGSIYTTPSSLQGTGAPCDSSNYDDCSVCHPSGVTCSKSGCPVSELERNPDREKSGKVPPVLPALNGVFSMRYDFWRHMSARLNTGIFLPGFWSFELSVEWVF